MLRKISSAGSDSLPEGVTVGTMPRTNQDGKDIKLVLSWLNRRHMADTELAAALDMPPTNYSRRKDADDFPTFEELDRLASAFGLSARALQIAFGHLGADALVLLDVAELRQYAEQATVMPDFPTRGSSRASGKTIQTLLSEELRVVIPRQRRTRRVDAPPGP